MVQRAPPDGSATQFSGSPEGACATPGFAGEQGLSSSRTPTSGAEATQVGIRFPESAHAASCPDEVVA